MNNLNTNKHVKRADINDFLALKFLIIESLKIQGYAENGTYAVLKWVNLHEMHFNN